MIDTLQEIYGELRRNRLRTLATGFAVTSGLFLLIVLLGAGNGLIHAFQQNLGDFAFDAIHVYGGMTTKPYAGNREGRRIQLDERDVRMSERNFAGRVGDVLPTLTQTPPSASYGSAHIASPSLIGVYPAYRRTMAVKMLKGRFINEIDLQQTRKSVVVGSNNCDHLFPGDASPIGKALNVSGVMYTVVGVFKANEMSNANEFYVPYTTLAAIYNRGEFIDQLTMTIQNIPSEAKMEQFTDDYYRTSAALHNYDPTDRRALWIWNQARDNIQMQTAMSLLHTAFWVLGLLTLLSGIVGVSNIMLISVKERTHEFGIRRAIGARPWSVVRMVMLESVVITALFGYAGMVLGILFCEWMDHSLGSQTLDIGVMQTTYFVDPTVDLLTCVRATVIIIIAGALAGFFPARKAVKVKPIEALRG
ncbi:MAG: ABC transporter permease [Bacteroidaceae bacterium]|nr:ABC transporter permease [Bacteroidaceae bacterium]